MTYEELGAKLDKYDTYTRGQVLDAYEAAEYATIDRVLKIIDEYAPDGKVWDYNDKKHDLSKIIGVIKDDLKGAILALQEGIE